jgi:LmbE family N-acetylglucosaminyl deacetylase
VGFRSCSLIFTLTSVVAAPVLAQLEPPSTGGVVALAQELRMLGHNKRVLMIGAHPDDEDTELLTVLVRGMGAEAAYLSLNRGEGGQNLIGSELGEALGLIRTEELLAARRLDGAHQFFTRAYDFGFTKTLEETWRFWPRDSLLKDVVRTIREFRPQVIVTIFSGTPRDGHGQHQAAGWLAREGFRVAGDTSIFPDAGRPIQPLKLYQSTRFDTAGTTLRMQGGVLDPYVGQSYRQIAMRGRSMHRSQDMGQIQRAGPSEIRLRLIDDRTGKGDAGLFAGIDTTLGSLIDPGGDNRSTVDAVQRLLVAARAGPEPDRAAPYLDSAIVLLERLRLSPDATEMMHRLEHASAIAHGMVFDAVADDGRIIPGQGVKVTVTAWNTSAEPQSVRFESAGILDYDHAAAGSDECATVEPGQTRNWVITFTVPPDAAPISPYFLELPRAGSLYQWSGPLARTAAHPGDPANRPLMAFSFRSCGAKAHFAMEREVAFMRNDQAIGEVRRPVEIVPRVDVKLDPETELWPTDPRPHAFSITLTNGGKDTTSGTVTLEVPAGWPVPERQNFQLTGEDEREGFRFSIHPPANFRAGSYEIRAVATDTHGARYDRGVFTVDYPHIRARSWSRPSTSTVNVAPLTLARLRRIGYIRGAADMVPEALTSVGLPIVLLDAATLERGDLSAFDAIVVGSRAYETDPALVENNGRLLEYARQGGLVLVQYQQQFFFNGHCAPFPLTVGGQQIVMDRDGKTAVGPLIGHDRVTDENAPVRVLDPAHPVFTRTNHLGPDDWKGWIQERGLYFAHTWDPAYQPLLEMADPGEAPLKGGLLVARYGKGTYVYTGLSFFRELPAGVPGAFRLFANLLALAEGAVP